ncbi:unnamed protein product, partial [Heterosigma akashiwo]
LGAPRGRRGRRARPVLLGHCHRGPGVHAHQGGGLPGPEAGEHHGGRCGLPAADRPGVRQEDPLRGGAPQRGDPGAPQVLHHVRHAGVPGPRVHLQHGPRPLGGLLGLRGAGLRAGGGAHALRAAGRRGGHDAPVHEHRLREARWRALPGGLRRQGAGRPAARPGGEAAAPGALAAPGQPGRQDRGHQAAPVLRGDRLAQAVPERAAGGVGAPAGGAALRVQRGPGPHVHALHGQPGGLCRVLMSRGESAAGRTEEQGGGEGEGGVVVANA